MLTRMYLYSTSTKLSIDVWLYLDRPGSLNVCCVGIEIYVVQKCSSRKLLASLLYSKDA